MARYSADWIASCTASLLMAACSASDTTLIPGPSLPGVEQGNPAFLGFPERAADWEQSPRLLSQTPVFADLARLAPSAGLLPYSVQSPLFSDGAHKQRWLALPSGTQIGFSPSEAWSFPEGTVFVKEFDMALDERRPAEARRLETRFLIAARGGAFYGLSYAWNEAQTDAELLDQGRDEALHITGADGVTRTQTYSFPAQSDCAKCHSAIAGGVLGARTAQLNGEYRYPSAEGGEGFVANQLAVWEGFGFFDRAVGNRPLSEYPQLADLGDASKPLEQRIRSYWESNCAMCHNADSPIPSWDARYVTRLEQQGVLGAESYAGPDPNGRLLVAPGAPERSLMVSRATSTAPLVRMPPLLRNSVDEEYVAVLRDWIASLHPADAAPR